MGPNLTESAVTQTAENPVVLDPRSILTSLSQVVYDWRLDNDSLSWGSNAADVLGIREISLIRSGRDFSRYIDQESTGSRIDAILASNAIDTGNGVPYQLTYLFLPNGMAAHDQTDARLWIEDTGRWFAGVDGRPSRAHGVLRVINDRREAEQRLTYLASFDELTGQLNRVRLTDCLSKMIEDAQRVRRSIAFLVIGVDGLSAINDAYGFAVADEVIAAVARRIRSRMRAGDALGRYSGNKFGVAMANCDTEEMPVAACRFIEAVAETPVATSVGPVNARISIGGVLAPRFAATAADAMARAQESLDLCRATRRGGFLAFAPSTSRDDARRENARITDEVVNALNERRIAIAYQPIVDARTRRVAHHECLVRLCRADGSELQASSIVPVTEKLGLIRLIDQRVLELAVDAMEVHPGLRLAINLSAATFADQDWLAYLAVRLHRRRDIAERLTVEITESAAIADVKTMADFVGLMKDYGVRVAIDDFGAGYTSFRVLRDLDVDCVKIDGVFVQNMSRSADDRFFVRTMIDLAKHLGLKVVAEWVQDETTARLLRNWGCDYLQGALFGMGALEPPMATSSEGRIAV